MNQKKMYAFSKHNVPKYCSINGAYIVKFYIYQPQKQNGEDDNPCFSFSNKVCFFFGMKKLEEFFFFHGVNLTNFAKI
jgi:hypothetical protein